METNTTALERAFELARSGRYKSIAEIKRKVSAEGYFASQLDGPSLNRQLRALIAAARPAAEPEA